MEVPAETVLDSRGDFVQKSRDIVCERAVNDDDIRVEGVQDGVEADADVVGEVLHDFSGIGVAVLVILDEALDRDSVQALGRGEIFQDSGFRDVLLEAAPVAAGAGTAVGEENRVAEFAGITVLAGVEFTIDENSHSDALVDVQEDHVFKVLCTGGFTDHREVCLVFYNDRNLKFFFEEVFQVGMLQIVIWGK